MSDRLPALSPSGAALWQQCPRRWWHKYIDRLPDLPPGEAAVVGTFVHAILEELLARESRDRTTDQARSIARALWQEMESSDDFVQLGLDEEGGRRFRQRSWATMEAYFSCERPEQVRPLAREIELEVTIDGVPFRGFVDLVEEDARTGQVTVTDYKTGRAPPKGKPWSADQEIERLWQPHWYAAALAELDEWEPEAVRLLYFSAIESATGGYVLQTAELADAVTAATRAAAGAELHRRWEAIGAARAEGSVEASPGPLCGWCPFVAVCAEGTAECTSRWNQHNSYTGGRRLRADAPAVALLGFSDPNPNEETNAVA